MGAGSEPLGASESEIWPGTMEGEGAFPRFSYFPQVSSHLWDPVAASRKAFGILGWL